MMPISWHQVAQVWSWNNAYFLQIYHQLLAFCWTANSESVLHCRSFTNRGDLMKRVYEHIYSEQYGRWWDPARESEKGNDQVIEIHIEDRVHNIRKVLFLHSHMIHRCGICGVGGTMGSFAVWLSSSVDLVAPRCWWGGKRRCVWELCRVHLA